MKKITKSDVVHISNLSNLKLNDLEVEKLITQLSNILNFISQLQEVDTNKVELTSQTTGLVNILREDEVRSDLMLTNDAALSGTGSTYNGFFKVPAIIDNRSDN